MLSIHVNYVLFDDVRLQKEYLPAMAHVEGSALLRGDEKITSCANVAVNRVGSVVFIDSVARVRACEFNIEATGLSRTSRGGIFIGSKLWKCTFCLSHICWR